MQSKIENTEINWEEALVMVCDDCGKQFDERKLVEAPERIKTELKAKCKTELGKKVRVMKTSCLGICPENKIAIAVASKKDPEVFKAYVVETDSTGEELFKTLLR